MIDTTHVQRVIAAISAGMVLLLLSACSRITQESYDKLSMGMKYSKVVEILGEPNSCKELLKIKRCVCGDTSDDGGPSISINFFGDDVVLFSNTGLR